MLESRELMVHVRRREQLLARIAEDRGRLREHAEALRPAVAWMDLGLNVARKARAAWATIGPLLKAWGVVQPEAGGWIGRWARGLSMGRSMIAAWRAFRG